MGEKPTINGELGLPSQSSNRFVWLTSAAVFHLKKLKVLDGVGVELEETAAAQDAFAGKMSPDVIAERCGPMLPGI